METSMLKIKKRVPMPEPRRPQRKRKYPFESMAVGDMFFVPGGSAKSVSSYASLIGAKLEKKFNTRQVFAIHRSDGWQVVDDPSDHPKAVEGIGVWRKQ
jgi:hypothetical protein